MKTKFSTIDPAANRIPELAVIQKVNSPQEQLPNDKHEKAVHAFLIADAIASGISNDLSFVDKIPQFINEIIDNKSWECLYVSKAVAQPYYCCYDKGTDSENFRAFINAKRPNGLGTSVETLDRVLQAELDIQRKFRAVIYESRQGERTDLDDDTSRLQGGKLDELSNRQQERVRATERAAEAIPVIGELLDRGLINIDIAARLGRQIKDPDNLTAEEREYIDKRDLVGLRINQYINTNTIPEDEDKEPAYRRQLNEFVKDLLGIKNRSKAVRMDNPKKAAEKLLKFYEGQKLQELLAYLRKGLNATTDSSLTETEKQTHSADEHLTENNSNSLRTINEKNKTTQNSKESRLLTGKSVSSLSEEDSKVEKLSLRSKSKATSPVSEKAPVKKINQKTNNFDETGSSKHIDEAKNTDSSDKKTITSHKTKKSLPVVSHDDTVKREGLRLTRNQLGERFGLNPRSISNFLYKQPENFSEWTQKKDPEGIAWKKENRKKGRTYYFIPVQIESNQ